MSEKLDRRIAVEVMGEQEPPTTELEYPGLLDRYLNDVPTYSKGGNWQVHYLYENGDVFEWRPVPFSSDLDHAMRAYREYCKNQAKRPALLMEHYLHTGTGELEYSAYDATKYGYGRTLPEAICNLLLALVEKKEIG